MVCLGARRALEPRGPTGVHASEPSGIASIVNELLYLAVNAAKLADFVTFELLFDAH